jgi:hypothetical protein
MSRTALTPQSPPASWATALAVLTLAALDASNGNSFPATGREVVIFQNTDSGSQTATISSVGDNEGRTGDMLLAMAAGSFAISPMLPLNGWKQTDGNIYISTTSANIKAAVVRFP